MPMPHGLNALDEFAYTILLSSKVEGAKALSTLVIGLPDSGKTEILMQFSKNKKVFVATDLTSYGLTTLFPRIQNNEIKTIIIPDLARIVEGRGKAGEGLIAGLNSLVEEGVLNIATFNVRFLTDKPAKCNVLAALTISSFQKDKSKWANLGFLSRVVPFFLGYCEEDVDKSLRSIRDGLEPFKMVDTIDLDTQVKVSMTTSQKDTAERLARFISKVNSDHTAFRSFKNLMTLAKAHAILRGKDKVGEEDMIFLKTMLPFWYKPTALAIKTKSGKMKFQDRLALGNDCEYYILKCLPTMEAKLLEQLAFNYTEKTIKKHLEELMDKGIIVKESNGILRTEVD